MAQQLYTNAIVYVKGALLTEAASVSVRRQSGNQRVMTIAKGWAGVSPGAKFMELQISNAVPAVGFEYDPGADMDGVIQVPLLVFAGDSSLTTVGFIEGDDFKYAINQEAVLDFTMTCTFARWQ